MGLLKPLSFLILSICFLSARSVAQQINQNKYPNIHNSMRVKVCNSALEVGSPLAWATWGAWAGCFGAATVVYNNGLASCTTAYNNCNAIINRE